MFSNSKILNHQKVPVPQPYGPHAGLIAHINMTNRFTSVRFTRAPINPFATCGEGSAFDPALFVQLTWRYYVIVHLLHESNSNLNFISFIRWLIGAVIIRNDRCVSRRGFDSGLWKTSIENTNVCRRLYIFCVCIMHVFWFSTKVLRADE